MLAASVLTESFLRAFHFPYLHFTAICLVLLAGVLFIWVKRFRLFWDQFRRKRKFGSPYDPRLYIWYKSAVQFWSVVLFFVLLLLSFSFYLAGFQYIGLKVPPSGQVTRKGNQAHFISVEGKASEATVKGPQTAVAGLFLRFPNWMRHLGLRSYHRFVTLRGNEEIDFHYGKKPDHKWMRNHISDPVLLFLYRHRDTVRFLIDINYTESVYFSGDKHIVNITPQGYIIQ